MFSVFWRCLIPKDDKTIIQQQQQELCPSTTSPFDRLPSHVVGNIFGNLPIGDRVRMRLVSKSWRDMLVRSDYPVKPEPPWLILPIDSSKQPKHLSTEINFESMSEERAYRFKLPVCRRIGGRYRWCCCGSGGGWLLLAGRKADDHNLWRTVMILWDPISGTTKRLPALSTLPFFCQLVDTCKREGLDNISSIARAHVFSVGSVECVVVAVAFSRIHNHNLDRLALCSPQEQSWSVVPNGPDDYYNDILFHNGHLYTICKVMLVSSSSGPGIRKRQSCTVGLSCCDVEVTKLEILYDRKHFGCNNYFDFGTHVGLRIRERWNAFEHLVVSSADGKEELLVVCAILDMHSHNDGGGEGRPTKPYSYTLTGGFEVYELDVNGNNCRLERLRNVGKQCIFVGPTGSTSVEAEADGVDYGNIIHFATSNADGVNWENEGLRDYDSLVVHERGVFNVARDIVTTHWKSFHYETRSCAGWFTPKLY